MDATRLLKDTDPCIKNTDLKKAENGRYLQGNHVSTDPDAAVNAVLRQPANGAFTSHWRSKNAGLPIKDHLHGTSAYFGNEPVRALPLAHLARETDIRVSTAPLYRNVPGRPHALTAPGERGNATLRGE